MEFIPSATTTRYIAIPGISFQMMPLANVGVDTVLEIYPEFLSRKIKSFYSCVATKNGCVLKCVYISNQEKEYRELKGIKASIAATKIKNQYLQLYAKKMPKDYSNKIIKRLCKNVVKV
jgi:hypothetical protein